MKFWKSWKFPFWELPKSGVDSVFLFFVYFLFGLGILAMYSASAVPAEREFNDSEYYLWRQLVFGSVGIFLFLFFAQLPYNFLVRWSFVFCFLSLLLLLAVFIPGLGKSVSTSYGRNFHRWIQIGGFQFQPSEFSKISLLLYLSYFFHKLDPKQIQWDHKKVVSVLVVCAILLLIVIEPAFGTTLELLFVIFFFILMVGFPWKRLAFLGLSLLPLLFLLVTQVGYRRKRLEIWLDPYKFRFDEGHQLVTSFRAFYDGAWLGKPIGTGYSHRYLAYSHTDFVLSSFVEDFGFIGFLVFWLSAVLLLLRIFQLLQKTKDRLGYFLGTGILLLLSIQMVINLYVITGIIPVTGISLPLISYGGSSLITIFVLLGILASIVRKENLAV